MFATTFPMLVITITYTTLSNHLLTLKKHQTKTDL